MIKHKTIIKFNNNYNRQAYKIGTRITTAQVPHRVGYWDEKSNMMFYDQYLSGDAWLWLVNKVKANLNMSPKDAGQYVNNIYKTKLKHTHPDYFSYLNQLSHTCGKLFSVVPAVK